MQSGSAPPHHSRQPDVHTTSSFTSRESEALQHASAGTGERLTFRLGSEEHGIDVLRVQEIRGYEPPTRIANAPPFITVVLNVGGRTVGAVVDAVSDVIELGDDQIKSAPEFRSAVHAGYIVGIGDIEQLMASPEMGPVGHQPQ